MNVLDCFKKGNRYSLISTDDDSCDDIIAAFIASCIGYGYKCIYFTDNLLFSDIEYFLKTYNLDITELIAKRRLELRSAIEFYIKKKAFSDQNNLQRVIDDSISEGYSGVAVISDRSCFYENGFSGELIYTFEKDMRDFYRKSPAIALTCYNIDKFGVDAVFALTHLNPNFIYKRDNEIYVHDREKNIFSNDETLGIVFNFLKNREKVIGENKVHQFIGELSSEISYKKEEKEILEATISNICKYSKADYGVIGMLKDSKLDAKKIISRNVPDEILEICKNYADNGNGGEYILSKGFDNVNYLIVGNDDLSSKVREVLLKYNIHCSIVIPMKNNNKIHGYIWLATHNQFVSFNEGADFLYKSCEKITKMIVEFRRYKRIQDTLFQAREMKALGELTGGIVHEFNNILTPVLGYAQILKGKINDPVLAGYIEHIENSAADGARIVKRIQEYAKIKKKIKESVDIDKAIAQCVEITKPRWTSESQIERKFIDVQLELKSGSIVKGVPTEIREVFVNLISNAVDAMPLGGIIKIKSYNDSDEVVVKISDNGTGMDCEIKERIFEPFFTTKNERGNGLGLPIVLSIVNDMGGGIEVESERGKGTEFTVRVPSCIYTIKNSILKDKISNAKGLKILIIDDQEAVAKTVSEMLITLGYDVIYAVNEKDAVGKFLDNDVECVICDLAMPESTGIQISEKLGKLKVGIPFILMTGWLGKLNESKMAYINEIIQKPFSLDEISEAINRAIERPVN